MISVFYQSASTSRILGSIPQGLISSVFIFSWFHRVLVISSPSIKGGFFQKVQCIFKISIINIPNHYLELKIWISCLLSWAGNSNFKFRIVIWNITLSENKLPLDILWSIRSIRMRLQNVHVSKVWRKKNRDIREENNCC